MDLRCVFARRERASAVIGMVGLAATLVVASVSSAEAARRKKPVKGGGYNPPYAAMVVDVKTGRTLHAQNEDALRHPASVTKVMTLYMLFEQLERGRLRLDSELRVSAYAAGRPPSKIGLRPGSTITVEDAIKALVTKSANDVASVVAENLGGTEEDFAEQMTRKARSLGMSRTVFRNASGLPDPQQVTTARDLTILARAVQDRFPRYYSFFQARSFTFAGRTHGNHNKLLGRVEGVDGIKTGFTRASGFNLMTNAKTEDRHIVAIVLGGKSGASRDQIMAGLVRSNLPRAFAGARTAPTVAEARSVQVAAAGREVETTAATPARQPLDLNAMRPAVASVAGGSATTPSAVRWSPGAPPANAMAYAAPEPAPRTPMPLPPAKPKTEERVSGSEIARPASVSAWVIQLGAVESLDDAKSMLDRAKSNSGRTLSRAAPFTEKVVRDGATLYRARFSGFEEADDAQEACRTLKRSGFACFATRS